MSWLVFSYSLPSKSSSSPRVTLWRRLKRIGAIAFNGVQVLPAQDECLEAFTWLAQEVQKARGEALVMRVEQFEGVPDADIIDRFRATRQEEYAAIMAAAVKLESTLANLTQPDERSAIQNELEKLYKQQAEISRIDFFDCPEAAEVMAYLNRIAEALSPSEIQISTATLEQYQSREWVTRPRPHVDRLACIWLIRRFINPNAIIRYAKQTAPDEVAFDTDTGEFQHQGNLCTFEVMIKAFGLNDLGLQVLGQIVHEIDLRDGQYQHPQTPGVDALLRGWLLADFSDQALEKHGIALFEGLYAAVSQGTAKVPVSSSQQKL
jgi:hypothetical protein